MCEFDLDSQEMPIIRSQWCWVSNLALGPEVQPSPIRTINPNWVITGIELSIIAAKATCANTSQAMIVAKQNASTGWIKFAHRHNYTRSSNGGASFG